MAIVVRPQIQQSAPDVRGEFANLVVKSSAGTPEERADRVRRATSRGIRAGVRVTKGMYRPAG